MSYNPDHFHFRRQSPQDQWHIPFEEDSLNSHPFTKILALIIGVSTAVTIIHIWS